MGGATQSKLAFINSTLKKKSEDLNKTKNAAEETKTQVHCHLQTLLQFQIKNSSQEPPDGQGNVSVEKIFF
jgi:hypothetical protein